MAKLPFYRRYELAGYATIDDEMLEFFSKFDWRVSGGVINRLTQSRDNPPRTTIRWIDENNQSIQAEFYLNQLVYLFTPLKPKEREELLAYPREVYQKIKQTGKISSRNGDKLDCRLQNLRSPFTSSRASTDLFPKHLKEAILPGVETRDTRDKFQIALDMQAEAKERIERARGNKDYIALPDLDGLVESGVVPEETSVYYNWYKEKYLDPRPVITEEKPSTVKPLSKIPREVWERLTGSVPDSVENKQSESNLVKGEDNDTSKL